MFTDTEKRELRKLLSMLPGDDLLSLAGTLTGRLVEFTSEEDAIAAVLSFSTSSFDVLRRQKMKRDFLYLYLISKNVVVSPSTDKRKLIKDILKLWGASMPQNEYGQEDARPQFNFMVPDGDDLDLEPDTQVQCLQKEMGPIERQESATSESTQIAVKFCEWFYPRWNGQNPNSPDCLDDFLIKHFWDDVVLNIYSPQLSTLNGSNMVHRRLLELVKMEHLIFNVNTNLLGGAKGFIEPHGLVVVIACGTVHQMNNCIGLFEQKFGLIKDPAMENNFRIKFTELRLSKNASPLSLQ